MKHTIALAPLIALICLGCDYTRIDPAATSTDLVVEEIGPATEDTRTVEVDVSPTGPVALTGGDFAQTVDRAGPVEVPVGDGQTVRVPAGTKATVRVTARRHQTAATDKRIGSGSASGAGVTSNNPAATDAAGSPPQLDLNLWGPSAARGGGFDLSIESLWRGPLILLILGGLLIAAGIVLAIWAGKRLLGIALAVAGAVLIAAAILAQHYPWIILVALAALVAAVIALAVSAWRGGKLWSAFKRVVAGIESAPIPARDQAKTSIAKSAGSASHTVRDQVRRAKADAETSRLVADLKHQPRSD